MNYKVLYRKYRPDDFETIVGQSYITKTLKNSVVSGNVSHAYLFSGPRGTGKTSTAKVFAKAINCINNTTGSPCNNCEFCNNYLNNPDIIEIDAASHNGVDQIRELIDNVKLVPSNGKYKIYIIDEVHMLTPNAFNALLLTLEEPPAHVIFILATTNVENVPITILSRCQRFDFKKISVEDILNRLKDICNIENINITDDALKEISVLSEGGLRDALSILDQLSKNDEKITLEIVEKQMKTVSNSTINEMMNNLENNNISDIMSFIANLRDKSVDYKQFTKKLVSICSDRAKHIKSTGKFERLSYDDYQKIIYSLIDIINKINLYIDPFTLLELLLLKYININEKNETKIEIIKEKENLIEIVSSTEVNIAKEENMDEDFLNIRINNCFVDAKKECLNNFVKLFNAYISTSKKFKNQLLDAIPVVASDKYAIITTDTEHEAFNLNEIIEDIEEDLKKDSKLSYNLIFISNNRWLEEKKEYINKIKSNYKFEFIKEKKVNDNSNEIIDIADGLFDSSKIEVI